MKRLHDNIITLDILIQNKKELFMAFNQTHCNESNIIKIEIGFPNHLNHVNQLLWISTWQAQYVALLKWTKNPNPSYTAIKIQKWIAKLLTAIAYYKHHNSARRNHVLIEHDLQNQYSEMDTIPSLQSKICISSV